MKISNFLFTLFLLSIFSVCCAGQIQSKKKSEPALVINPNTETFKSTPAFAEVLLRKTELEAELESLLINYTEDFPKVLEIKHEMDLLKKAIQRLSIYRYTDLTRLTLALGKLMVEKAKLETDLWSLRKKYDDAHAEVKRAKRKTEIYEASIREILG